MEKSIGKGNVIDMTEGSITRLLLAFFSPLLIGNIFQQVYNMVDSIVVGNFVGAYALGAVGACSGVNFLFFSFCNGLTQGVGILVSQYFGAKNIVMVKKAIMNGLVIVFTIGILMGILALFCARPVLVLMNTPTEYIEDAILYLKIVGGGTIGVAMYNVASRILQALGDSKTPLKFLVVSSFLNVILDLLFVVVFRWGVKGAAIATVVAQAISAILSLIYAIKKNTYFQIPKELMVKDNYIIRKCLSYGIPIALQNGLISFSIIFLQSIANRFGANISTAYAMTGRLEQLIHQPYVSMAAAISTFTGQNIGANKIERVKEGLHKALTMCAVFSLLMFIVIQLCGTMIMRLFGDDIIVISIAGQAIRITSYFYFMLGIIYIVRALLNGAGDSMYPMINGIMEVAGRIGFALIFINVPFIGSWAVWYTAGLTWTVTAIASVIRYRQGKWNLSIKKD